LLTESEAGRTINNRLILVKCNTTNGTIFLKLLLKVKFLCLNGQIANED